MADATGVLADLILARLAVPLSGSPKVNKLHAAVAPLLAEQPELSDVTESIEALRAAGQIKPKALRLTDAGLARGTAFLLSHMGVKELPEGVTWVTIRNDYLVPRALGLTPGSRDSLKRIDKPDKLAARLVKLKAGLPAATPDGLVGVFEALVCRALGFADQVELKAIREAVVYGKLTELTKSSGLSSAALRDVALAGAFVDETPARPLDLAEFARAVNAAAGDQRTPSYGGDRVFISRVWNRLRDDAAFGSMAAAEFKDRLVEASKAGLVRLSRLDLVQTADSRDVRDSEVHYLGNTFHFILPEGTT